VESAEDFVKNLNHQVNFIGIESFIKKSNSAYFQQINVIHACYR